MPERSIARIMLEKGFLRTDQIDLIRDELKKLAGLYTIGPYQVIGKLGEGGMGAVYKAYDEKLGRMVAIKLMKEIVGNEGDLHRRFMKEARSLARLNHPHIVTLYDFDVTPAGAPYMVMEFIEGVDLAAFLRQHGGMLEEREALQIARQIAEALQHAFENGLIHRDVKPPNVMIDRHGHCKLSDFGLAKSSDSNASQNTGSGIVMGSPDYFAPEQALAEKLLDIRVDIYALGAALYEMTTGTRPFLGTPLEVVTKHIHQKLPPPEGFNPALSSDCAALITRMMEKNRDARFATPADLIAVIDGILKRLPTAESRNEFVRAVAGLPPESQVKRVQSKLQELNPGLQEDLVTFKLNDARTGVQWFSLGRQPVQEVWPVRALARLENLSLIGSTLNDLNVLAGLPLTNLWIDGTHIITLAPLRGMQLKALSCEGTRINDLEPLQHMPLNYLCLNDTDVADLAPLHNLPLAELHLANTPVSDLSPLLGLSLIELDISNTAVRSLSPLRGMALDLLVCGGLSLTDLSPLQNMPLTTLDFGDTPVVDLTPLMGMPLKALRCQYKPAFARILKTIPSLKTINGEPAATVLQ
ncbi:MAG TPA: protein kinase [Planctomycetota bacterium]|nr:protein kinase [Planctomycetota bacterium]